MTEAIRSYVKDCLGEGYRLRHTLFVEKEVLRLAALFSLDEEETRDIQMAALLHDITKGKDADAQKDLYAHFFLPFGEVEAHSPKTLHAVTGAYVAREAFPEAVNARVFDCIRYHTTAAPDMTLLQKLLYLADYIEEGRTFPSCVRLRQAFYHIPEGEALTRHLDRILLLSLDQTLTELVEEQAYIHPTTLAARNFLIAHL